jgi:hypothetical protein
MAIRKIKKKRTRENNEVVTRRPERKDHASEWLKRARVIQ